MAIEFHGRWKIAFDAKFLPPADQKECQGRSLAHWDGNTLVVETTNFKQDLWLDSDGVPLSRNGKMVTRIRKVDNGVAAFDFGAQIQYRLQLRTSTYLHFGFPSQEPQRPVTRHMTVRSPYTATAGD